MRNPSQQNTKVTADGERRALARNAHVCFHPSLRVDPVFLTTKRKPDGVGRSGPRGRLFPRKTELVGEERVPHAAAQNGHEERPLSCGRLGKGIEVRGVMELPRFPNSTPLVQNYRLVR